MHRGTVDPSVEKVVPEAKCAVVAAATGLGGRSPTPAVVSEVDARGILAPLPDLQQTVAVLNAVAADSAGDGRGIPSPHVVDAVEVEVGFF